MLTKAQSLPRLIPYEVLHLSHALDTKNGLTRRRLLSFGQQPGSTSLMINSQAVYRPSLVENSRVTMSSVEQ
jgi:hypothetical protein